MRVSGKTDGKVPAAADGSGLSIRRALIFSAASILTASALPAQVDPSPEQPAWSADVREAPPDVANPSDGPSSGSEGGLSADPSVAPTDSPAAAGTIPAAVSPGPPTAGTDALDSPELSGVPTASHFFLPSFDYYDRPLLERDGLKFRLGPVNLRFSLTTRVEYNDNIFGQSMDPIGDQIFHAIPGIRAGVGDFSAKTQDYFLLNYQPSFDYYLTQTQQNRVSQNLEIGGQATFSRYSTSLDLLYATSNQPNATQSGGQGYSTLNVNWVNTYYLGGKVFIQAAVTALSQDSEIAENSNQTFALSPQLGYTYSPKTTFLFGPSAGIAYIGDGATQTFQGISAGIQYDTLRKLAFKGNFGLQARQFQGSNALGAQNFITPVFNLGVTWAATATSSFVLGFTRDVQISDLLSGQTYTTNAISLSWSQQILQRLSFGLSLNYQMLEYQGDGPLGRSENYIAISPSLSYSFWRDAFSVSAFYNRQQRTSDLEGFNYNVNSYGFGITYNF